MTTRLVSSSRIALAAYLHDLGKFAERARIEEALVKDDQGITAKATNEQMYLAWKRCFRQTGDRHGHA